MTERTPKLDPNVRPDHCPVSPVSPVQGQINEVRATEMGAGAGGEHTARGEGGGGERLGRGSDVHNCQSATCEGDGPTKTTSAPIHIPPHNHKHTRKRADWRVRSTRKAGHMPACGVCVGGAGSQNRRPASRDKQKTRTATSHTQRRPGRTPLPRSPTLLPRQALTMIMMCSVGGQAAARRRRLPAGCRRARQAPQQPTRQTNPPKRVTPTLPQCHSR